MLWREHFELQLSSLVIASVERRENSWDAKKKQYKLNIEAAVYEEYRSKPYTAVSIGTQQLVVILLTVAWNDTQAWATEINAIYGGSSASQ